PFIMENSISGPDLDPQSATLYKYEFNSTVLEINFFSTNESTIDYELFGTTLPKGSEIDQIALDESFTPSDIQDRYLNLPPSIETYKANNPYFYKHWKYLNEHVIEDSDNAFIVADKIRNYLQNEFSFPTNPEDYQPAPEGVDIVEWFCQTQVGVWSDFASAFVVFCRAFGVASRFVDGFHSREISQEYIKEEDSYRIPIKYRNIYNWGEIFVPTSQDGDGQWVQMDVYFQSYLGTPPSLEEFNITVRSDKDNYYRHELATINATLSSATDPVDGKQITFRNVNTDQVLGTAITDQNGTASITIKLNNTHMVGPNIIIATYNPLTFNYTEYLVYGNVSVHLLSVVPQEINISTPNLNTHVTGYVYDPVYDGKVANATVNFVLFQNGTSINISNAFFPDSTNTNENGDFDLDLTLNNAVVPSGFYEIRVDFNGSWNHFPLAYGIMSASSNRMPLNVTEYIYFKVDFFINNTPTDYPNPPNLDNLIYARRNQEILMKVNVSSIKYNTPLEGETVEFYDYTNGNVLIGTNTTNSQGIATIHYSLGPSNKSGPTLVYVKVRNVENYSYFVLNESISLIDIVGPNPFEINRIGTGSIFNITCNLQDDQENPIYYGYLTLKMFRFGSDYSNYLNPQDVNQLRDIDGDGYYDMDFGVASDTPLDNYTLRLDFNSTFDFTNDLSNPYPHAFYLKDFNYSVSLFPELKIEDPNVFIFNFYINGTTADDYENPKINRNGHLNLTVYVQWGKTLAQNGDLVGFYDKTNGTYIGHAPIFNGWANLTYITTKNTIAGPHLIQANYSTGINIQYNYSYFILDAPIQISLTACPSPRIINNIGDIGRNFTIQGSLIDPANDLPIKNGTITVHMFNGLTEYSSELVLVSGSTYLGNNGIIDLTNQVSDTTLQLNYTLEVWFNGTFEYSTSN
ncbi:MAG: transglutaminase domain-containing protein, partial [Promethearchaeota archaeon]